MVCIATQAPPGARPSPISGVEPPAEHRFRPGTSGNPRGRPPGRSITKLLRQRLSRRRSDGRPGAVGDMLVEALIAAAVAGDMRAIREIFDRVDGKAPDGSTAGSAGPAVVRVEYVGDWRGARAV